MLCALMTVSEVEAKFVESAFAGCIFEQWAMVSVREGIDASFDRIEFEFEGCLEVERVQQRTAEQL